MKTYLKALKFVSYEKGITISLFFVCLILSCLTLIEPFFFKEIVDSLFSFKGEPNFLKGILNIFLFWSLIILANIFAKVAISYLASTLANKVYYNLWNKTFAHILTFSVNFFQDKKLGTILRSFERGLDNIYLLQINFFRTILINLFIILILIPVIFFLNYKMALIITIAIPLLIAFVVIGASKTVSFQKSADKETSELSGIAYDSISNIFLVKSFVLKDKIIDKTLEKSRYAYLKQKGALKWWGFINGTTGGIGLVLTIMVFIIGSLLYTKGEISLGTIIMFVGFTNILISVFNSLFWNVLDFLWEKEKINSFFEIWEEKPRIISSKDSIKLEKVKGEIEFKDVYFSYENDSSALNGISFKINPGEMIAFVGHTGSGKTTTANLISRFYEIKNGEILIDGINLKNINIDSLRKNIAIVFQENTFFNASFLENLKINNEREITEKEIEEALKKAYIFDLVKKNKKGLNQIIGDRGLKLSGGEKQRLSIARAILKDAPILILDEATSALDAETENKIQLAISNLIKDRTTIVIAHRLSTIKKADRIFVFENGKIIETGNFDSLMKKKGTFSKLVSFQMNI